MSKIQKVFLALCLGFMILNFATNIARAELKNVRLNTVVEGEN